MIQLFLTEIEIGERGILDLIREYNPESGVPLAAFINKFLPARAIEASRRVLGEEFTEDVTEARDIAAEEVTTEAEFNQVKWKTGEDSDGGMISTTTCPHSEITWTKVKAEIDKL